MTRYFGVDLAWGTSSDPEKTNETGLALIDSGGVVLDAGWARGLDAVESWISSRLEQGDVLAIDAPLVVNNPTGQRECEREVSSRYMYPWKVGANSSNLAKKDLAGVELRQRLEQAGVRYADGLDAHDAATTVMFECYPYTTIVGAPELGFDLERPWYKRLNRRLPAVDRKTFRASACDELIAAVAGLRGKSPRMDLTSHPVTAELIHFPSPLVDREYKHREDLLDATLCAWTAALWATTHLQRVQILGAESIADAEGRRPTIVAPARPTQRREA